MKPLLSLVLVATLAIPASGQDSSHVNLDAHYMYLTSFDDLSVPLSNETSVVYFVAGKTKTRVLPSSPPPFDFVEVAIAPAEIAFQRTLTTPSDGAAVAQMFVDAPPQRIVIGVRANVTNLASGTYVIGDVLGLEMVAVRAAGGVLNLGMRFPNGRLVMPDIPVQLLALSEVVYDFMFDSTTGTVVVRIVPVSKIGFSGYAPLDPISFSPPSNGVVELHSLPGTGWIKHRIKRADGQNGIPVLPMGGVGLARHRRLAPSDVAGLTLSTEVNGFVSIGGGRTTAVTGQDIRLVADTPNLVPGDDVAVVFERTLGHRSKRSGLWQVPGPGGLRRHQDDQLVFVPPVRAPRPQLSGIALGARVLYGTVDLFGRVIVRAAGLPPGDWVARLYYEDPETLGSVRSNEVGLTIELDQPTD